MLDEFKGTAGFWRGVFSEADGTPSSSRIFTGLAVAFSMGWITHVVVHNHALPDTTTFFGVAMFISALYGLNAAKSVLSDFLATKK
jgi:hypothetical protein